MGYAGRMTTPRTHKTLTAFLDGRNASAFAREIGISQPYLVQIAAGERTPSLEVAQRIATATDGAVNVRSWPKLARLLDAAASIERGAA